MSTDPGGGWKISTWTLEQQEGGLSPLFRPRGGNRWPDCAQIPPNVRTFADNWLNGKRKEKFLKILQVQGHHYPTNRPPFHVSYCPCRIKGQQLNKHLRKLLVFRPAVQRNWDIFEVGSLWWQVKWFSIILAAILHRLRGGFRTCSSWPSDLLKIRQLKSQDFVWIMIQLRKGHNQPQTRDYISHTYSRKWASCSSPLSSLCWALKLKFLDCPSLAKSRISIFVVNSTLLDVQEKYLLGGKLSHWSLNRVSFLSPAEIKANHSTRPDSQWMTIQNFRPGAKPYKKLPKVSFSLKHSQSHSHWSHGCFAGANVRANTKCEFTLIVTIPCVSLLQFPPCEWPCFAQILHSWCEYKAY